MKKSKILTMAVVSMMAFSLVLTGCGKTEENKENASTETVEGTEAGLADEQILRINLGANPPDLDPQTATDSVSYDIINSVYEGLVRIQPDGSVVEGGGLAESWTISEDGLTYTFKLRDANWSDGTPIKASDFEYSWKRALDPATASQYAYMLYPIKNAKAFSEKTGAADAIGIKTIDDKTLEVVLEAPTPYFLSLVAYKTYMPLKEEAYKAAGESYGTDITKMVFSGPFVIEEWNQEQNIVLAKNTNYWDAETVKLEQIKMDMIGDLNTPINLYETGELDGIGIPTEYLAKYRDSNEFKSMSTTSTWYLQYNCLNEYTKNVKIRKAFSLALDRQIFIDNVLANGSLFAGGLVPQGFPGMGGGDFRELSGDHVKDVGVKGQEAIDEANKLLDEGLAEIGKTRADLEKDVTYLTEDVDVAKKYAQAFQQMWKENLGLNIQIETVTFKVKLDRENKGDFQISFSGWSADYLDAMTYMDLWITGGGNNKTNWSNKEYDALIAKATPAVGDERYQAMVDAEKILMDELPIAPVYFRARNTVEREYVKGWVKAPFGASNDWKWTYIAAH